MQISMLRPVGSRVPNPANDDPSVYFPWDDRYHTEFVDSGTSALSLAVKLSMMAKNTQGTPEVILPAYGCPDLVSAVIFQGAKPVLVDLGSKSPCISLDAVGQALTSNTVAIIAVDFLGFRENLDSIRAALEGTGVWLIEDSAQAFPPASSDSGIADCVVLSFGRGKPINLMGGGALLIRRDHLQPAKQILQSLSRYILSTGPAWRLKRFVFNLLLSRPFYGLLARIPFLGLGRTEFVALDAISSLKMPPQLVSSGMEHHHQRTYLMGLYLEKLAFLNERGWLCPPALGKGCLKGADIRESPRLLRFPLLAPTKALRDKTISELQKVGIGANALYGDPLPGIPGMQAFFDQGARDFPNAFEFSSRLVLLPLHEDVGKRDIERAARILERTSALN